MNESCIDQERLKPGSSFSIYELNLLNPIEYISFCLKENLKQCIDRIFGTKCNYQIRVRTVSGHMGFRGNYGPKREET